MSDIWIRIACATGGYSVAAFSIFLGYELLLAGTTAQFSFEASVFGGTFGLKSVAPGIGFALFGMVIAIYTARHLMGGNARPPADKGLPNSPRSHSP